MVTVLVSSTTFTQTKELEFPESFTEGQEVERSSIELLATTMLSGSSSHLLSAWIRNNMIEIRSQYSFWEPVYALRASMLLSRAPHSLHSSLPGALFF